MKVYEAKIKLCEAVKALTILKHDPRGNNDLKKKVASILDEFCIETIAELKNTLHKRKKKRLRQANQRVQAKKWKSELKKERNRRNEEADVWLKLCREKDETAKAEENVRREVNSVLQSFKRKKAEARRILSRLPGRVRQLLAQCAEPSEQTAEAFDAKLQELREHWEKQLETYIAEEAALKVILEEGSASKSGQLERETDAMLYDWLLVMFGEGTIPEISWDELVESRRSWDRFVVQGDVPLSSALPAGWLLPQPLTRQDWKDAVNWF